MELGRRRSWAATTAASGNKGRADMKGSETSITATKKTDGVY